MPAKRPEQIEKIRVSLPATLKVQLDALLIDETGKPAFGARSRLIEELIRRHLEELSYDSNRAIELP